jgi:predicted acylesterase/phospholipase RssA
MRTDTASGTEENMNEIERAHQYLGGEYLAFDDLHALWKKLRDDDEISLARRVLAQLRLGQGVLKGLPADRSLKEELCRQEAMLTSKDPELRAADRHDLALSILAQEFDLGSSKLDGDAETLGVAGGIYKRRWDDLGQMDDLIRAAALYERGIGSDLGEAAYAHINAAFVEDLLAQAGDEPAKRRERATALRERIARELPETGTWWNTATRAEALLGLGRYAEATQALKSAAAKPEPWALQTTARQLAHLARMREERPLDNPDIRAFFDALLPGAGDAVRSVIVGKVGLALSGGGFRASFYHLGVLARLAELDVLRHVEVLSCVSGGSIVGACYWLALRNRLLERKPLEREDYIDVVSKLIKHFQEKVATNLRGAVQPNKLVVGWRFVRGELGALDPDRTAAALAEHFYRPLLPEFDPLYMHQLKFTPADHDPVLTASPEFQPGKHNWLRAHKVPVLVLNATTVNTGHAWQFTPTWMGESPWSIHEAADSVPRLEWSWYAPQEGWQIELGRAVAASACVPGIFAPVCIEKAYDDMKLQLVDGGVHDNQGTVSLLALNCNVLLVSDASGQLMMQRAQMGLGEYAKRSMDTLMERVRLANFSDLSARLRTGLLRGLMFLHMKAGLDADSIRLPFSQEAYELNRAPLSPSGVRKEFQQALAELRTDLDAFTQDESYGLMACGYQMASKAFERDLAQLRELWEPAAAASWPFQEMLSEITSTGAPTPRRRELLGALREGSKVVI